MQVLYKRELAQEVKGLGRKSTKMSGFLRGCQASGDLGTEQEESTAGEVSELRDLTKQEGAERQRETAEMPVMLSFF